MHKQFTTCIKYAFKLVRNICLLFLRKIYNIKCVTWSFISVPNMTPSFDKLFGFSIFNKVHVGKRLFIQVYEAEDTINTKSKLLGTRCMNSASSSRYSW